MLYLLWAYTWQSMFSRRQCICSATASTEGNAALDLHAKMTTQTERKPFRIIFPRCGSLYKRVCRSSSQVHRCLALWAPGGSLIFLHFSFSILESKDCVTGLPLNSDPHCWVRICMFLYTENQLGFGKITLLSVQRVTSERATQKSTGGILKESLWHPSPQTTDLHQSEAGPADAQVTAHQAL